MGYILMDADLEENIIREEDNKESQRQGQKQKHNQLRTMDNLDTLKQ